MNVVWSKFLRSAYRKEPISSFVLTVGVVDAVIGGFDDRWSLVTFGVGTVGLAIALRWWLIQRSSREQPESAPTRYLPARSSRPPLPMLTTTKQQPPQY